MYIYVEGNSAKGSVISVGSSVYICLRCLDAARNGVPGVFGSHLPVDVVIFHIQRSSTPGQDLVRIVSMILNMIAVLGVQ